MRKIAGQDQSVTLIRKLRLLVSVAEVDENIVDRALASRFF